MTAMPPLAVLAGGLATRMRPLTETVPKSMLPVCGEPFIAHQLRLFERERIERVVLCVGHLWEQIADFVGDGASFGLQVDYSVDALPLLGTGGSLKQALPKLGEEFLVCYGDSYLDIAYAPVVESFRASGRDGLMTVYRNDNNWDTSNVVFDGREIRSYSKTERAPAMTHIDWGLGAFRATAFADWPSAVAFDLATLYARLLEQGALAAFEVDQRFYEMGSFPGLAATEAYLRARAGDVAR
jgi:NDP-sugar pyrophosphorylase family protein